MDIAGHTFLFMAVAAFAVFFVGVAKAGFGGMIGSLAMPLVATFSDIATAISVLFPTYFVMDVIVAWIYRKSVPWGLMWPMAAAGVVGAILGAFAFRLIDPPYLAMFLGAMSMFIGLRFFWQQRFLPDIPNASQDPSVRRWPRLIGLNGASGFTRFFLMGEAPIQVLLLPFRLAPQIYVSLLVWFFFMVNAVKVPIVIGMGIVTLDSIWISALLLPVMPFGIFFGKYINSRLPKEPFYVVVHVLLIILGVYLMANASTQA
jgi:uncharacterized membrane protein YfcA